MDPILSNDVFIEEKLNLKLRSKAPSGLSTEPELTVISMKIMKSRRGNNLILSRIMNSESSIYEKANEEWIRLTRRTSQKYKSLCT